MGHQEADGLCRATKDHSNLELLSHKTIARKKWHLEMKAKIHKIQMLNFNK